MKRTGWIGILLLAWISVAAWAVQPLAAFAGDLPGNSGNDPVYCLSGTPGDENTSASVDGDPDDVIGGNKGQTDTTDADGSGDGSDPDFWLIEEFLRYVIPIIWLQY